VLEALAYPLFALGAFVCCLNFYLSCLRCPLSRLTGGEYKHVSGFPLVGSLSVVIAVVILRGPSLLFWGGATLALLDTGGLHWFVGVILWAYVLYRGRVGPPSS
jgi:hypothetical protein